MARAYASFVLRCWRLDAAERRITVEHIQSGERVVVASIEAAVEWICARESTGAGAPPATSDRAGAVLDTDREGGADG